RICRVAVDVLAVERLFDYSVPEALAEVVGVGTIVRVNLGGRRVRAWVVEDGVVSDAPPEKLRPLAAAVSAGPPPGVVDLTAWARRGWAGRRAPARIRFDDRGGPGRAARRAGRPAPGHRRDSRPLADRGPSPRPGPGLGPLAAGRVRRSRRAQRRPGPGSRP